MLGFDVMRPEVWTASSVIVLGVILAGVGAAAFGAVEGAM
jgi:hypothetical protein